MNVLDEEVTRNMEALAKEISKIRDEYKKHLNNQNLTVSDFELYVFKQSWGNTSGGFEECGGDMLVTENTYVLIPKNTTELCQVYFAGQYAYSAPKSAAFIRDAKEKQIAGCHHNGKYFKESTTTRLKTRACKI